MRSKMSNSVLASPHVNALPLIMLSVGLALLLNSTVATTNAAPRWSARLDGDIRFYQTTEFGVLVCSTEKSLYALDGETGAILWGRRHSRLDQNDIAPVPGTDILLLSLVNGSKSWLEALDLISGETLWRSDKVRGAVMQLALDTNAGLLALVLVREARGKADDEIKRKPVVQVFELGTGKDIWKRELESEVEMMPVQWRAEDEVPFTLDNYRPPVFLDNRLYLFYEGLTSLDAQTGKDRKREKFRVNEDGLALTEADPVADERNVYVSGRGRVRAISRTSGEEVWEAKDVGLTPEMILTRNVLYVRTGGQFTRQSDGENVAKGPFGVRAIDVDSGKILWRYKGADKGITNIALPDSSTIVVADRDDLIMIDTATGKRRAKSSHKIERAAFVVLNEKEETVVGGRNEIAAFDSRGQQVWRSHHDPPGRGLVRTVGAVAARAASLYFRYGGTATTAFRGVRLLNTVTSLRWSGLTTHTTLHSLTSLAASRSREYVTEQISSFGILSKARQISSLRNARVPSLPRPTYNVEERLLDRLDPAQQLDRLARFLWRRRRLATLRGDWMYFYTSLRDGNGLVGINVNNGRPERTVRLSNLDERFISDEAADLLYVANDNRLLAYPLNDTE